MRRGAARPSGILNMRKLVGDEAEVVENHSDEEVQHDFLAKQLENQPARKSPGLPTISNFRQGLTLPGSPPWYVLFVKSLCARRPLYCAIRHHHMPFVPGHDLKDRQQGPSRMIEFGRPTQSISILPCQRRVKYTSRSCASLPDLYLFLEDSPW